MVKKRNDVLEIHKRREEDPPAPRVRWIIPVVAGPAYAHAMLTSGGGTLTLCSGHHVTGAVYPPSEDVPRCAHCAEAVGRLRHGD